MAGFAFQPQQGGGGMSPYEAYLRSQQMRTNQLNSLSPASFTYGKTAGTMLGGMDTMANLGNSIGNAFDMSNMLSSQNMQAKYAPMYNYQSVVDTNDTKERMQQDQLRSKDTTLAGLLPHIIAALSGMGGQGIGGFQTNYGAGAQLGSQARPTNTQSQNPLLALLGGQG